VCPLTIFFGRNNSGKSSLLRLPRLLLRALSSAAPRGGFPLDIDGLPFGRSFRDVVHGGSPHGSVSFHIDLAGDEPTPFNLSATIQNVQIARPKRGEASELEIVSRWELRSPGPRTLEWEPAFGPLTSYRGAGPISFRGLMPEPRGDWAFLEPWQRRIDDFQERVTHLGPLRMPARPTYEATAPRPLGLGGEEAAGWLLNNRTLLEQVGAWFETHLDGWRLGIDHAGSAFHCILSRGPITVNLADAGQGMQQVLPLVIQQFLHDGTEPFLDLIEQPELHLHSAAQAPLGDLFLDTAKQRNGTVIVETHSENLLLRIRRRIAESAEGIDPSLVALYWVDERPEGYSEVERIHIGPDGEVDNWPEGVFSEGYEEIKALRRAQRRPRTEGT
jgi:hypothetical protein